MYEEQTFEAIMKRMLDRVSGDVDKREGSVIYDALAPIAFSLAEAYADLDINWKLSSASTASGEYLEWNTSDFGVTREPATKAKRKGVFEDTNSHPKDIPVGSRFSIEKVTYKAIKKLAIGEYVLESEVPGEIGNKHFGKLLPIDFIEGLASAELTDIIVPGEDEEDDESLRKRYFDQLNEKPFGGNIPDYQRKLKSINGVGGVKIFPSWKGGGTVKCTIIASDFNPPSPQLVEDIQTEIDPVENAGKGIGWAPIGHAVTIAPVHPVTVEVSTTLVLNRGVTVGQIREELDNVISEYLLALRKGWEIEDKLIVRVSQLEARILTVSGVADIAGTQLNGAAGNLELGSEEVPLFGGVQIV
ncbi:baseplate J/gp47 family protein [Paenibacillus larvae]|uniref:Baseplate J/gp47 family protein n=3 Tax=Paenibacillus larvae TaxID=1464 RepID=A0AAP5N3Q8_9BACL|nr:baseplate J/gp47 family protein [Paenibacillus larvae]AQR77429.1 phage tail protein [Paenibacillus larvae subsp. larvae]AVF21546.1 phage capsid assembly-like protein [Paenibacillus larvae subsp. larvae]ETK30336.1 phage capsid assembly-like protein [Paenibacillus larvae subsp. larvae DSM 25719]MCY7477545.1 baseplate J/gp47 family protein [Paenibacillus larvae]MCY7489517.1 baseplate J/gp47 family protein [Paenibacillus larvae]